MVSAVRSCCCAGAADAARAAAEVLHGMAMGVSNFLSGCSVEDGESTRSATMCSLETSTPNEASRNPEAQDQYFPDAFSHKGWLVTLLADQAGNKT